MALSLPPSAGASRSGPFAGSLDLEINGLSHGYGGRQVLDQIDLTVAEGSLTVLAGPSGCGKSTLLRLIAGLEVPEGGRVLLGGEDRTGRPGSVGLVFQEAALYPWLTVAGNVSFGLRIQGHARGDISARVGEVLDLVGLTEAARMYPHQLSGGMAQRAALARALVAIPSLLLLDEPFGSVDLHLRSRLQDEVIRLWRATGSTIILVTHSVDEAVLVGERVVLMSSAPGRLTGDVEVPLPFPRDRKDADFLRIRDEVFEIGRRTHTRDFG
ncbi:MAG: ABC transporter ATP-binding protein [Thermoleophilia bacterium]